MNYEIKTYPHFDKELKKLSKKYPSMKADIIKISQDLLLNPDLGVDLGNGVHKIRMAITSKGKGKSGGARIISLIIDLDKVRKEIGLHFIYDKSERETIKDKELQQILRDNGILG
jgi:hypothetical protein